MTPDPDPGADPRRWFTLAITTATVVIISLDTTVLNVAIPTILREFHTTLPSLQWVVTGYALTFASLLIIGGRLGDLFGHRRIFTIGAALFGVGSLIAAVSQSVPQLVIGEAVIEGIGAALMMPCGLAILSNTFVGHERAVAFGIWGAVGGASAALGPVVGGFLTSTYSWRWSFGLNVVIVPFAIVGAIVYMPKVRLSGLEGAGKRESLDIRGAILAAVGMALLVFGLSEGTSYGWLRPTRGVVVGGRAIWPTSRPVSLVSVAFVVGGLILTAFYRSSRAKERLDDSPLFEFGQLRHPGFRYGLITVAVLALGQLGLAFVLPVYLQEGLHLSAARNGLWQLPIGLFFLIGAQISGRLARRVRLVVIIRIGLGLVTCGFGTMALIIAPHLHYWQLVCVFAMYGTGLGLSVTQITNIVLSDVDADKAGAAGGANNTARQMGFSLGVAIISALLSSKTIGAAITRIQDAPDLSAGIKTRSIGLIRSTGVTFVPPAEATPAEVARLRAIFSDSLAAGAKWPLFFACTMAFSSLVVSTLIPRGLDPAGHAASVADPELEEIRLATSH